MSQEPLHTHFGVFLLVVGVSGLSVPLFLLLKKTWTSVHDTALLVSISAYASVAIFALVSLFGLVFNRLALALAILLGASCLGIVVAVQFLRGKDPFLRTLSHKPVEVSWWWTIPLLPVVALAFSSPWNFMMAHGMDAGNYEVVSNYFAYSGSFWFDGTASVSLADGNREWVYAPGNTWSPVEGALERSRPYYFPLYPALLGSVKFVVSSMDASSTLSLGFGILGALGLYGYLRHLRLSPKLAVAGASLSSASLLYLYYSKQIMSEQFALLLFIGLLASIALAGSLCKRQTDQERWLLFGLSALFSTALLLTKLDAFQPVLLIALAVAGLASLQKRFLPSWLGCFAGVSVVAFVIPEISVPSYVSHARLPVAVPVLGDLAGQAFFLAAAVGLLVSKLVFAAAFRFHGRFAYRYDAFAARVFAQYRKYVSPSVAVLVLLLFVWLVAIRPVGTNIEEHLDSFNVHRLALLWSPLLVLLIFIAMARSYRGLSTHTRTIAFAMSLSLVVSLIQSRHSAPDLWWMRRYLLTAVPLGLFAFASVHYGICRALARGGYLSEGRRASALVASLMALSLGIQGVVFAPLFGENQNVGVSAAVSEVASIRPDVPLHVVAADRGYVGFANAIRSQRSAPTIVAIDPDLFDAFVMELEAGSLILIPTSWEDGFEDYGSVLLRGETSGDWANWRRELAAERSDRRRVVWSLIELD